MPPQGALRSRQRQQPAVTPAGMAKGGSIRGDGCATRGKTKGRMV
jgi:hypothetical protein